MGICISVRLVRVWVWVLVLVVEFIVISTRRRARSVDKQTYMGTYLHTHTLASGVRMKGDNLNRWLYAYKHLYRPHAHNVVAEITRAMPSHRRDFMWNRVSIDPSLAAGATSEMPLWRKVSKCGAAVFLSMYGWVIVQVMRFQKSWSLKCTFSQKMQVFRHLTFNWRRHVCLSARSLRVHRFGVWL